MAELIWDGKYVDGKRQTRMRVALPFQTIETVNESAPDRQRTLDLFAFGRQTEWRNRLIWGDKKDVLLSLLPEFARKVNLIYIDPPLNTGQDFSFTATMPSRHSGQDGTEFLKEPSSIETKPPLLWPGTGSSTAMLISFSGTRRACPIKERA